ncbi:xanthine dehydrogenase [Salipiger pallidus]|uniref:Xanthine dehydrogenase n=1 Tax=Salipiger pallidus TaxID=1775170 RepID=A0A8J2ZKL8_9RHOB|nr:FAD binding domain-containing protein [Salipiger pallidus]GGG74555.1 xanthine dehydrogenase [Salipiger pallidus]
MPLHRPETLSEALSLLAGGGRALGGGTDLYPALRDGPPPADLVDLMNVAGLRGVSRDGNGWRIGGATTWTDILRADLPPAFDGLKQASREVGSVQIQNAGTVAGNLCNASPAADGVPALLTLEADVELSSQTGTRRMPLSQFITGPRRTELAQGEILSAIFIPETTGSGAFLKLGARRYLVISIAMVAAVVEIREGLIVSAKLAAGSCAPVAQRLRGLEAQLVGKPAHDAAAIITAHDFPELAPIDDVRAPAEYRRDAVAALTLRTLNAAISKETAHVA